MNIITTLKYGFLQVRDHSASLSDSFYQLEQLLNAGVPIDVSLEYLTQPDVSAMLDGVWADLAKQVNDGLSLSLAMKRWPRVFDADLIAIVSAGEASASLSMSCRECRELLEWRFNLKNRFKNALIYPVFALSIVSLSVLFLLVYLVPSLEAFLISGGLTPAWHTRLLLQFSNWLVGHYSIMFAALFLFIVFSTLGYRCSNSVRRAFDTRLLKMPLIGCIISGLSISRYSDNCARLYRCGIPLESAMQMSEQGIGNKQLRKYLSKARSEVRAGLSLSSALKASDIWPDMAVRILRAGESTGALQEALIHVGRQQWQMADLKIGKVEKLIGPFVLVCVALVLMWIVLSLLGPIYHSAIDSVVNL